MIISIVMSGDYAGCNISNSKEGAYIQIDKKTTLILNSSSVLSYELIDSVEDIKATSKAKRGVVGGFLGGGIGALAAMSTTKGEVTYRIKLIFTDGKVSIIQCDKFIYDKIIYHCLNNSSAILSTPVNQTTISNKFCSSCGSPVSGAGKFCTSCGLPINSTPVNPPVAVTPPSVKKTFTTAFPEENAQNIILCKGIKYDLDTIFVECKGKAIKFSMRMMKEAKDAKLSKDQTIVFTKTIDLYFKPKMEGKTPNIGVVTIE